LSGWRPLLLFAVVIALLPWVVRNEYYVNVLVFVALNSMLAIGLTLLFGCAGQISLGHAAFYGLGAYTSGILTASYHWPIWPAMLVALLLVCAVAWLVGKPTLRLHGHYLAMATLGFGVIVNLILVQAIRLTGGSSGLIGIPRLSLAGFQLDTNLRFYFLAWGFTLATVILARNLVDSRVGRALRAIHGSETAADTLGINTPQFKVQVFVLSAALAAVAGSLRAHFVQFLSPEPFNWPTSIALLVMVVIGGMGNVWGAILGAAAVTVVQEALRAFRDYDILVFGLLLVAVAMFFPGGLVGLLGKFFRQRNHKGAEVG
jgi:branched-chain amino acid transport system permease protein